MSGSHLSKDFFDLIKNIGEAKSKQEEDQIIGDEVQKLQTVMQQSSIPGKKMKEYLLRMLYCEMLGHDASFGHIHGVNMIQGATNLVEKRVGYLAVMATLHSEHNFIILLINTIQKDLKSSNYLEVCAALTCVCKLINKETIPAVYGLVVNCLNHSSEFVRKKAVIAMHRFFQQDPTSVSNVPEHLNRMLCDRDPCVMAASLSLVELVIREGPISNFKSLTPSLVSILKQIIEHRLSNAYDYHRTPAPWCQVQVLRCLGVLGQDKAGAEEMYEMLNEVLRRSDTGVNIGYAVTYECVRTICKIYPNTQLIDTAAAKIGELLRSDNHNLRYMGINLLALIIQVDPKYAGEHQMVVIDCLEDADETLKRKTLALLFKMTNQANVAAVVEKMLHHLKASSDEFLRVDLVAKITELAERFAPNNEWYINTMNIVFLEGRELCRADASQNVIRLLAEGTGEDEEADVTLRRYAVRLYVELCQRPVLTDIVTQVLSWVLGEYTYLEEAIVEEDVASHLCDLMERNYTNPSTRCWIVTALSKLIAQIGFCPEQVKEVAEKYAMSRDVDLQTRCLQLLALSQDMNTAQDVLPVDASCEDLEWDSAMSFLDEFVEDAIEEGGKRYIPPEERGGGSMLGDTGPSLQAGRSHELHFAAYPTPEDPYAARLRTTQLPVSESGVSGGGGSGSVSGGVSGSGVSATPAQPEAAELRIKGGGKGKWGQGGYQPGHTGASFSKSATSLPTPTAATSSSSGLFANTSSTYEPRSRVTATPAAPSQEKQKLASSLFSGMSTGSSAGSTRPAASAAPAPARTNGAKRGPATKPGPAAGTATAPPPTSVDLLLDLGDSFGPAAPTPSLAPPAEQMDLLSLMDMGSSPAPAPTQPSTTSTFGGLDALFDTEPQRPLTPEPQRPSTALLGADPTTSLSPSENGNAIASDDHVVITLAKQLEGHGLALYMTVANTTSAPIRTVSALFDTSSMGALQMTIAHTAGASGSVTANKLLSPFIGAHSSVTMCIQPKALPLPLPPIRCQFHYTADKTVALHYTLQLTVGDFLSPLAITEAEFGAQWGKCTQQKAIAIPHSSLRSPDTVAQLLQQHLCVSHIATKKNEVIAACHDIFERMILVHCRVGSRLDLTVRSADLKLSESLTKHAFACLQGM